MNITQEQTIETKYCPSCEQDKPLSDFTNNTRNMDNKEYRCKSCHYTPPHKKAPKEGFYDVDKDYGFLNKMDATQGTGHIKEYHQPKGKRK